MKERKPGKKHASVLMDIVAPCQTMIGYQEKLSFSLKGFFTVPPVSKSTSASRITTQLDDIPRKPTLLSLPRNVYILLVFTLGKGFQLTIAALTLNYYVHSLGYRPDFIGLFSAVPAIGSLVSALPVGRLADRIGRKPVLVLTAVLSPLFLALCAIATSAPLLLLLAFIQGLCSTGYWVTNLPLLVESTTERQRVGVLAMNSFLLLGIGALGNLLGGAVPELVAGILHVSAASSLPLRWGVFTASAFTFVFGIPLWFLRETQRETHNASKDASETLPVPPETSGVSPIAPSSNLASSQLKNRLPIVLFVQLLLPDLLLTTGEGSVVALIQIYFVLRFHLLPGTLGIIFTFSGLIGGIFSLTAPLFVRRWSKLRLIVAVQYLTAPLMILIGFSPNLPFAISGEYARSFMRTLIDPVYAAFAMERVSDRYRATLAGFYSITWSIGYSIGPAVAGWLQTDINLSASFIFGALCLTISPTLLLLFFGKKSIA